MARRIGVFGGTFDPVHLAHLVLAERAREDLVLDRLLLIPNARPPHKPSGETTPGKDRLEMLELAAAGNDRLSPSDREIRRGGVSFTVETLRELAGEFPGEVLVLVLGEDALADLPSWREPEQIVRLAELAVARRTSEKGARFKASEERLPAGARIRRVEMPLLEISSSEIRARVARGKSIRYLVPAAVEAYIHSRGLYRVEESPAEDASADPRAGG